MNAYADLLILKRAVDQGATLHLELPQGAHVWLRFYNFAADGNPPVYSVRVQSARRRQGYIAGEWQGFAQAFDCYIAEVRHLTAAITE